MSDGQTFTFRPPTRADGAAVAALIAACPPLDRNSTYAYFLLCDRFADTCVLALRGDDLLGCITAFRPPGNDQTLFIWQAAVDDRARGQGLAGRMLDELLARRPAARWIETTISPNNTASRRAFAKLAENLGVQLDCQPWLPAEACGPGHEAEELLRLGPIPSST